jgi:hypothetical protein
VVGMRASGVSATPIGRTRDRTRPMLHRSRTIWLSGYSLRTPRFKIAAGVGKLTSTAVLVKGGTTQRQRGLRRAASAITSMASGFFALTVNPVRPDSSQAR